MKTALSVLAITLILFTGLSALPVAAQSSPTGPFIWGPTYNITSVSNVVCGGTKTWVNPSGCYLEQAACQQGFTNCVMEGNQTVVAGEVVWPIQGVDLYSFANGHGFSYPYNLTIATSTLDLYDYNGQNHVYNVTMIPLPYVNDNGTERFGYLCVAGSDWLITQVPMCAGPQPVYYSLFSAAFTPFEETYCSQTQVANFTSTFNVQPANSDVNVSAGYLMFFEGGLSCG